jgi:cytochrome c5
MGERRLHDYGIPHDQFPIAPQDGFSFLRWHQEITGPKEKVCPGEKVIEQTPAFIAKVAAILKAAQTGSATPSPYTTPAPVTWQKGDTGYVDYHDAKVNRIAYEVTCTNPKGCVLRPNIGSKQESGKRMAQGEKRIAIGTLISKARQYLILDGGHRVPASDFAPRIPKPTIS